MLVTVFAMSLQNVLQCPYGDVSLLYHASPLVNQMVQLQLDLREVQVHVGQIVSESPLP